MAVVYCLFMLIQKDQYRDRTDGFVSPSDNTIPFVRVTAHGTVDGIAACAWQVFPRRARLGPGIIGRAPIKTFVAGVGEK
jgi:hypothetical protein